MPAAMLKGTRALARTISLPTTRYEENKTMQTQLYRYLGVAVMVLGILVSADGFGVIWGA